MKKLLVGIFIYVMFILGAYVRVNQVKYPKHFLLGTIGWWLYLIGIYTGLF